MTSDEQIDFACEQIAHEIIPGDMPRKYRDIASRLMAECAKRFRDKLQEQLP